MNSAKVENGIVTNVIIGSMDNHIPCGDEVSIGWAYDGSTFSAPPLPTPDPVDYDALDVEQINHILTVDGSVIRALALLTFQEINELRRNAGLSIYTGDQFKAALKAKIR